MVNLSQYDIFEVNEERLEYYTEVQVKFKIELIEERHFLLKFDKEATLIDLILEDEEGNEVKIKSGTIFNVYEVLFRFTYVYTIIEGKDYDIYLDEESMEVLNVEYQDTLV